MPDLFVKKPLNMIQEECDEVGEHTLKRALGPTNLIALGIGAIIGTGIFVLTGQVAAQNSGPAVMLSFIFAGVACAFAGLCYAEFASLIPIHKQLGDPSGCPLKRFFAPLGMRPAHAKRAVSASARAPSSAGSSRPNDR